MAREKMIDVHIKIEPQVYERFETMSKHSPNTKAEIIRIALDTYIEKIDKSK